MSRYTLYELARCIGDTQHTFSSRVWITKLEFKYLGIPYTTSQQTFATIRGSLAKELGEVVTVPTISKGDMRITDSWKIAEYLEEKYAIPQGKSLFGGSVEGKNFCKFIEIWVNSTVAVECRPFTTPVIYGMLDDASQPVYLKYKANNDLRALEAGANRFHDEQWVEAQSSTARARLQILEDLLKSYTNQDSPCWINGKGLSHADFLVWGWYNFSRLNKDLRAKVWEHPSFPEIQQWLENMKATGLIEDGDLLDDPRDQGGRTA